MRIDDYRMSYLSMLLDLTEVESQGSVYGLERVRGGAEDFFQIIFNSPKGVKICLRLSMTGNLVAKNADIIVALGPGGERTYGEVEKEKTQKRKADAKERQRHWRDEL
jgi:CRISPR/Cas system CSM-associated protein Csm3 (group 7 of RAMP superfamily)